MDFWVYVYIYIYIYIYTLARAHTHMYMVHVHRRREGFFNVRVVKPQNQTRFFQTWWLILHPVSPQL